MGPGAPVRLVLPELILAAPLVGLAFLGQFLLGVRLCFDARVEPIGGELDDRAGVDLTGQRAFDRDAWESTAGGWRLRAASDAWQLNPGCRHD